MSVELGREPTARYIRTQGGRMIHLDGCRVLERTKHQWPWNYADGLTLAEVRYRVFLFGYSFCARCCP